MYLVYYTKDKSMTWRDYESDADKVIQQIKQEAYEMGGYDAKVYKLKVEREVSVR